MDSYPITKVCGGIAVIVAAIFAALGDTFLFPAALMWTALLCVALNEIFWTSKRVRKWRFKYKALGSVAIFLAIALGGWAPLKKLYYKSDEDLRLNFQFEFPEQDTAKIQYTFRNLGKQSAFVKDMRLVEIFGRRDNVEHQDSVALCDSENVRQKLLALTVTQGLGLPFGQIGGDDLRVGIYAPDKTTVDGELAKEPVPIESGKNKIVASSFKLNLDRRKSANFWVLCPVINTVDIAGHLATAICQGYSQTKMNDHATKVQEPPPERFQFPQFAATEFLRHQFRILPQTAALACPVVD